MSDTPGPKSVCVNCPGASSGIKVFIEGEEEQQGLVQYAHSGKDGIVVQRTPTGSWSVKTGFVRIEDSRNVGSTVEDPDCYEGSYGGTD